MSFFVCNYTVGTVFYFVSHFKITPAVSLKAIQGTKTKKTVELVFGYSFMTRKIFTIGILYEFIIFSFSLHEILL